MFEQISGISTAVFGILTMTIGLLAQYMKNRREHRFGMPLILPILGFLASISRFSYGLSKEAFWQLPPDILGIIITIALFWQYYRLSDSEN